MTFSPQQQLSKVRSRKRYTAWVHLNAKRLKDLVSLQYDVSGNAIALSHFASPITGEYNGRMVYKVGKKSKIKTLRA
jgi:ribosomal protein L32